MYVKYQMNSNTDYRGNVKLVVKVGEAEIAYSNVTDVTEGMVLLTKTEIDLVLSEAPGLWLTERESLQQKVDLKADDIRSSYLYNGPRSISEEYRQAEDLAKKWIADGSDETNAPEDLVVWAELNNQTVAWAAQSVITASMGYRLAISKIRSLRLRAKHAIRTVETNVLQSTVDQYLNEMSQYRCPIEY